MFKSSVMYDGAWPCRALKVMRSSLKVTHSLTRSQWSLNKIGVMWSDLEAMVTNLAWLFKKVQEHKGKERKGLFWQQSCGKLPKTNWILLQILYKVTTEETKPILTSLSRTTKKYAQSPESRPESPEMQNVSADKLLISSFHEIEEKEAYLTQIKSKKLGLNRWSRQKQSTWFQVTIHNCSVGMHLCQCCLQQLSKIRWQAAVISRQYTQEWYGRTSCFAMW